MAEAEEMVQAATLGSKLGDAKSQEDDTTAVPIFLSISVIAVSLDTISIVAATLLVGEYMVRTKLHCHINVRNKPLCHRKLLHR